MTKKIPLSVLALIAVAGMASCGKESAESESSASTVKPISTVEPVTSGKTSDGGKTSTKESDSPDISVPDSQVTPPLTVKEAMERALNQNYTNATISSYAVNGELKTTDIIYYYNDYQILQTDYTGQTVYQYFHDYDGKSYQYFNGTGKEVSGWLNQGYDGAYVGMGENISLDIRRALEKIRQYANNVVYSSGIYYIVDDAAVKDIVSYVYSWAADVAIDTIYFTIDTTDYTFAKLGAFDTNVDTDTNQAVATFNLIGETKWTRDLPTAPNKDNTLEYWQYKGYDGPQVKVFIKEVNFTVIDETSVHDVDTDVYTLEIEKTLSVRMDIVWNAPEGVAEERWIKDDGGLHFKSTEEDIARLQYLTGKGLNVVAFSDGDAQVYASWKDADGKTLESKHLKIHVNALAGQNLEGAVYNLGFNGVVDDEGNVGLTNSINNSLPYALNINPGCGVVTGRGIFGGENTLYIRSGNQSTMNTEFACDGVATFDFSDQQVSGISFYYGQMYTNNEVSALEKIAIETSNDGTTWSEAADITDEVKANVSQANLKLMEKTFAPASKVRIHVYGTMLGRTYGFSTSHVAFIADENCHAHYAVDDEPVTGVTIQAQNKATEVKIGSTLGFAANVNPSTATNKTVTWHVSDPALATIDDAGVLTPLATGTVEVYATSAHGATEAPVESNHVTITIKEKDKVDTNVLGKWIDDDLLIDVTADEATITWNGNEVRLPYAGKDGRNDAFGIIPEDGNYSKTVGFLLIKADASYSLKADYVLNVRADNGATRQANVFSSNTTLDKYIQATAMKIYSDDVVVGKTATVVADFLAGKTGTATTEKWTLKSDDTAIVTVDNDGTYGETSGLDKNDKTIKGVAIGKTTLTATSESGLTATVTVKVTKNFVTGIKVTVPKTEIIVGDTIQATATITPSDADDKTVTWKSSDQDVATVDANGKITAVAEGTVYIRATANGGTKVSDEVEITVKPKPAAGSIAERAGTWSDSEGAISVEIRTDGSVALTDYSYTSADDSEMTVESYDGTTLVLTDNVIGKITITFTSDRTCTIYIKDYMDSVDDAVTLTLE